MHIRCRVTVVGCVCVSGLIFTYSSELVKKTYGLPQHCRILINTWCFFVKQSLHKATKFLLKFLVQLSAILFAFASA